MQVVPCDRDVAQHASVMRAKLKGTDVALSLADRQIGGHALAVKWTLVGTDAAFKKSLM